MLRNIVCILILSVYVSNTSSAQNKVLKLPLTIEQGYGPFRGGFGRISVSDTNNIEDSWHTTYIRVKGFPKHWQNYRYGMVHTDFEQWTYQNYKQGKVTEEDYIELQKNWQWTPDEKILSATPIKCYVHCAWNIDTNGKMGEVIVDANNNLDFSDDTMYNAPILKDFSFDKAVKNPRYFKAQQYINGKITDITLPLLLTVSPPYVFYSIPIYGKAALQNGKSSHNFAVTSSGFRRADFSYTRIHQVKSYKKKIAVEEQPINEGEYITLNNKTYKYIGVDLQKMTFDLEEISNTAPLYSAQIGYYAFPFSDTAITGNEIISLEKYKGKYVFIDFWGTWCKPCVEEIPNVKKAYNSLDSNKIQFIGIALNEPEYLKKFIEEHEMPWPQLAYTSESDGVLKTYNINSYPTTLLIDPSGKIIAKNLRGEDLDKKLAKLIK